MTDPKENTLSLMEHLEELRDRLKKSVISVIVAFIIAYFFAEELFNILAKPLKAKMMPKAQMLGERMAEIKELKDQILESQTVDVKVQEMLEKVQEMLGKILEVLEPKMIFTALPDMFFTYLKISFAAGLVGASPYIFYQFWKFVAPGLYKHEQRLMLPFVITATLLFVGGALFGYFIVFPFGFEFFLGFSSNTAQALPSVREYFTLCLLLLIAFGIIFELPVVLFFLAKLGFITPAFLKKNRKYAILLAFIVATLLTPPDLFTQFAMAIPLIILYEISIFAIVFAKPPKKEEKEQDDDEETAEIKGSEKDKE